eukprot:COSAG01_NODE_71891_length_254_cov_1.006452_1_plen_28_part_10
MRLVAVIYVTVQSSLGGGVTKRPPQRHS